MQRKNPKLRARAVLARNLRDARGRIGISQEHLADLAGLHRTYVGSVERAERNVSVDNIERLALALGLEINELFTTARG